MGFPAAGQREIDHDDGRQLWQILVAHGVRAYLCSHMLAFDVQVHDGVLQILTAGAGTSPLMPPESEYHHLVQLALDGEGLRYQVLDTEGNVREWLHWPLKLPPSSLWKVFSSITHYPTPGAFVVWRFAGETANDEPGEPQTLLCAESDDAALPPVWIGLRGQENRLTVSLAPVAGRSPHAWLGPEIAPGCPVRDPGRFSSRDGTRRVALALAGRRALVVIGGRIIVGGGTPGLAGAVASWIDE